MNQYAHDDYARNRKKNRMIDHSRLFFRLSVAGSIADEENSERIDGAYVYQPDDLLSEVEIRGCDQTTLWRLLRT